MSNGEQEKALSKMPLPPKSPTPDILNTTGHSIATISNIDIAVQPLELEEPKPRKVRASKSVPDQKTNDDVHQKPTVGRRTPKHDSPAPQPHPRKQGQDLTEREGRRISNGAISQSPSSSNAVPVSVNRRRPSTEIQRLAANVDSKEDTEELLQEAARNAPTAGAHPMMSDAAYLEQHGPEPVVDVVVQKPKSPSPPAIQDIKEDTITLLKEAAAVDPKYVEEVQVRCHLDIELVYLL